jgi:CHAD domain-containing protein
MAVALVGTDLLDAARAAAGRLADAADVEALHDFRVALRRLRTLLRSFRDELGPPVPKKLQRRLRDLARATNPGRDAEVQLAWVRTHRSELGRRPAGLPWLLARLEDHRLRAYEAVRREGMREFRQLERRARRALSAPPTDAAPHGPTFGAAAVRVIREQVVALERELAAAQAARDAAAIHAARIAAKRLRYVIEPLAAEVPQATATIDQLKQLQDLLGELHDLSVLTVELGDAVAEAAAEQARSLHAQALRDPARPRPTRPRRPPPGSAGLLALARLAAEWHERLFQRLVTEWLDGALPALVHAVMALADALPMPVAPVLPLPRRGPRPAPGVRHRRHPTPTVDDLP